MAHATVLEAHPYIIYDILIYGVIIAVRRFYELLGQFIFAIEKINLIIKNKLIKYLMRLYTLRPENQSNHKYYQKSIILEKYKFIITQV